MSTKSGLSGCRPLVAMTLLLLPLLGQGATRYVSSDGTNDGSCEDIAQPCATINYARSRSFVGDTILVARGLTGDGIIVDAALLNFPLSIEGRAIQLFPRAWTGCVGDQCPTVTPPGGNTALTIDVAEGQIVSVSGVNFEGARGGHAVALDGGTALISDARFIDNRGSEVALRVASNAVAQINRTVFERNVASANGGAIFSGGELTVRDTSFRLNSSGISGGAIGGIEAGTLTLENNTFEQNVADDDGGAVFWEGDAIVISASDFMSNVAGRDGGALSLVVDSGSITGSTFENNRVQSDVRSIHGGAIDQRGGSLSLTESRILDNKADPLLPSGAAGYGGGVAVRDNAILNILASEFRGNDVVSAGGFGDGLRVDQSTVSITESIFAAHPSDALAVINVSALSMLRSTILDSSTGIEIENSSTAQIVNSTISLEDGLAAVNLDSSSMVDVLHTTVAVTDGDAFIIGGSSSEVDVINSIILGNCSGSLTLTADDFSIYDSQNCAPPGVPIVQDAGLLPLGDYGGPTPTHYPAPDSPARNRTLFDCLDAPVDGIDQRGELRPFGKSCDAGAVEFTGEMVPDVIFANGFE